MYRSGIGVWLRCFWIGFNPPIRNIFHVELNEKRRETCTSFLFSYTFITLDCSPAYFICTASKSRKQPTCRNESQVLVYDRRRRRWLQVLQLTLKQYSTFVERTLAATGVSRRTFFNIRKDYKNFITFGVSYRHWQSCTLFWRQT